MQPKLSNTFFLTLMPTFGFKSLVVLLYFCKHKSSQIFKFQFAVFMYLLDYILTMVFD